jgi:hypothetical protein
LRPRRFLLVALDLFLEAVQFGVAGKLGQSGAHRGHGPIVTSGLKVQFYVLHGARAGRLLCLLIATLPEAIHFEADAG